MCNVVPSNHFGPIPGVEVGTMWKFRVQVSGAAPFLKLIQKPADLGPGLQIRVRTGKSFSYFSTKTYVVGTQKNRLNETVLLSTQNTCLN